ncbi:hypothetical protein EDB89DRAFT_1906372 [Lactarius sanguifluus]|nr:hypothetical protein EDB89DRAFT_1906372 [Lactarius sanguifluus]
MARVGSWQSAPAVAEVSSSVQQAPQTANELTRQPTSIQVTPLEREAEAQLAWHEPALSNTRPRHGPHSSAAGLLLVAPNGYSCHEYKSSTSLGPGNSHEYLQARVLALTSTSQVQVALRELPQSHGAEPFIAYPDIQTPSVQVAWSWSLYQIGMTGNDACTRTAVVITGSQLSNIERNWGMLDIPAKLLLAISSHMDHHDLWGLALTSRLLCDLLLPEYLCQHGLKLKDTHTGGTCVELRNLSGYASLELWSIAPTFCPPEKMYCSIPQDAQDALSTIGFATRFLLNPSNASNLRDFHFSLWESDPLPIMSELIKLQDLYCVLPLTQLCISGHGTAAYLPPSITLRSGTSCGSHTLTSLSISSNLAFTPGLVQTTIGILNQSPIKHLVIYMVSLNRSQWSTLLGQLNMTLLGDIDVEGDIPWPALIRFLIKHRGLKFIRIRGNVPSDRTQPSRTQSQHFLPNLCTLHAPLTICCDIIRRASNPSNLYELQAELMETLRHFRKLANLGLRLVPSSTIPQANPGDYNWDGHPVCELRQVHRLNFHRSRGQDMMCAYIQSFPMPEVVHVVEEGGAVRLELLESLRKANPTLGLITDVFGSFLKWTADGMPDEVIRFSSPTPVGRVAGTVTQVGGIFGNEWGRGGLSELENSDDNSMLRPTPMVRREEKWRRQSSAMPMLQSPPSPPLVCCPYARMTSRQMKRRKLDWMFDPNDETGLILHKAGQCSLCDDWSIHFYDHHAANNPTLETALQACDREHDEGCQQLAVLCRELEKVRQELEWEQGRLRKIHKLWGRFVDDFQNDIGCLRNDILDAGYDPFQSHTPRRKYAYPPSPCRSEVPASLVVVAYSLSESPPDFSSKRTVPDKPQTSRGKEKRSNMRDAVESILGFICIAADGVLLTGYNVNKRSQATPIAVQNMQLPATPGSSRDTGEMNYPCGSSEGIWPLPEVSGP